MVQRFFDFCVTMLCWAWFTFGFILFFSWRYVIGALFVKNRESFFQGLSSRFYRGLFAIIKACSPRLIWDIDPKTATVRSSVIVCNHLSYLDPLLLIALFEKHRTIVKTKFFTLPIMGWVLRGSGYIPASGKAPHTAVMIEQMETMEQFLATGGNLFVFPEGTRSQDGRMGDLDKGALKIARSCRAPIHVMRIRGTDRLYRPGRFLFNTQQNNSIQVRLISRIEPAAFEKSGAMDAIKRQIRAAYQQGEQ